MIVEVHPSPPKPLPYYYGNVYVVWCWACKRDVKVVDPKTLHRPRCPRCDSLCRLPSDEVTLNYRV